MPEQAQRRADLPEPEATPESSEHAFEELRHIIISPEQEQIVEIRSRIENPARRIEDVSSVLVEAIELRRDQGDTAALAEALGPTVEEALGESVRKNPEVLADALFPVMGPAIRKSITETLRSMLESFNEALEHSISVRGIQWRIEALRTGKTFAEIVLMHSLLFRVEQVFLIHRETGLALNHVTAASVATQDPSLVAGMLSAIQQFVRDSFSSPQDEALNSMTVGDLEVWIEEGPRAVIASVIRGHAPADYRIALREAVEHIEGDFRPALASFQGDTGAFRTADAQLQNLLITQHREKLGARRNPWMMIAAAAAIITIVAVWLGYVSYQSHKWSQFVDSLSQNPGIIVSSYGKSGGRWRVVGFRDPLAVDPVSELARYSLNPSQADFQLAPFYSLDDAMVALRARNLLAPPAGVELGEHAGTLAASGTASSDWIGRFNDRARLIPGVASLDTSKLQNGEIVRLASVVLRFPLGQSKLESSQEKVLVRIAEDVKAVRRYAESTSQTATVSVIGHTDSSGIEGANEVLSNQRAAVVASMLARNGIPNETLVARGVGISEPLRAEDSEEARELNRSVTFHVNLSPVSSAP